MQKRGQVTVFIAVGILLLFSVYLSYAFMINNSKITQSDINMNNEILPIKNYISSCVISSSEEGLRQIGANGGYKNLDNIEVSKYKKEKVPIYLDGDKVQLPPFSILQSGLSEMILTEIGQCVDLNLIESLGFEISDIEDTSLDIRAGENDTSFIVQSPFKIKKGESTSEIVGFQTTIPFRIKKIHEKADWFIGEIHRTWQQGEVFNLSTIPCTSIDNKIRIHSHEIDNTTRVVQIIDYEVSDIELPYLYQFAIRKDPLDFIGESCS